MPKINKNIVIAALARDCEKALRFNIPLIEKLRERFGWSQVVVVENDSKDKTKELLFEWAANSTGIKVISQDFGTLTIPNKSTHISTPSTSLYRIEKMASYRNIYLDYIKTIKHQIDYVIIVDIDIKGFSIDGLIQAIEKDDNSWGAIFSNGITQKKYFGILSKIYFDCFAIYEYPFVGDFSYTQKKLDLTFKSINRNIKKHKKYSVISAFSGIGIYRYEAIDGLKYKAVINTGIVGSAVCEHIPFNIEIIKRGFKNYIDREFVVIYGAEHNLGLILKLYTPYRLFNFTRRYYLNFKKKLISE